MTDTGLPEETRQKFWDYLQYKRTDHTYSKSTFDRYVRSLNYLSTVIPIERPTSEDIENYKRMAGLRGDKPKTIENCLYALTHFNEMLGYNVPVAAKQRKQAPKQQYVPLPDEIEKIFKYALEIADKQYSSLITAVFVVATTTGARIGELARINVDDIDPKRGIYINAEKKERSRWVGVPKEAIDFILKFIRTDRLTPTNRGDKGLFTCVTHPKKGETIVKRYEPESLRNFIRERGRAAGIPNMNSHSNRRFVATELFRRGADLRRVQFHLGHSDISSVLPYVKLSEEIEARRNGEMLRPFFKKVFKRRKHNATKK
ncbi:MAG: site-specific integrase [Candidatus Thermoplasmatota archaeon]|nr:site-specific integrase [Candidatus Thermoplasmatota archaeon]MCL6002304.1 site-specific integrase [Candidatus Thermoplasmatota archaeon]